MDNRTARSITAIWGNSSMPGCDSALMDVVSEMLRRGWPEPRIYSAGQRAQWGFHIWGGRRSWIGISAGGGKISDGVEPSFMVWETSGGSTGISPCTDGIKDAANMLEKMRRGREIDPTAIDGLSRTCAIKPWKV